MYTLCIQNSWTAVPKVKRSNNSQCHAVIRDNKQYTYGQKLMVDTVGTQKRNRELQQQQGSDNLTEPLERQKQKGEFLTFPASHYEAFALAILILTYSFLQVHYSCSSGGRQNYLTLCLLVRGSMLQSSQQLKRRRQQLVLDLSLPQNWDSSIMRHLQHTESFWLSCRQLAGLRQMGSFCNVMPASKYNIGLLWLRIRVEK